MVGFLFGILVVFLLRVLIPVLLGAMKDPEYPNPMLRVGLTVVTLCLLTGIVGDMAQTYIDHGQIRVFTDIDSIIFATCVMSAVLLPIFLIGIYGARLYLPDE